MNTFVSLFGGLAGVLVLYAAGRAVPRLPPALRAALAGTIPLVAYFIVILGHWPGLDVVAIHISVFLAAALVLYAYSQFRRRAGGGLHWAPRLLIAFFAGLVVLNAALLHIATQGLPEPLARWWLGSDGGAVYSGFSGVVQHGQKAARAVSSELTETYRESQTGWTVDVSGLDRAARIRPLQLRVKDPTGLPVERVAAQLRLLRPGATVPAQTLSLEAGGAGVYLGVLTLPDAGRWLLEVRLLREGVLQYRSIHEVNAS
jgi:nitrogen fixation protein FixH